MSIAPLAIAASHSARGVGLAEICGDDLDLHALAGRGDRVECVAAPRRQHEINAERRELMRDCRPNAAGCAGHQRALANVEGCMCIQIVLLIVYSGQELQGLRGLRVGHAMA